MRDAKEAFDFCCLQNTVQTEETGAWQRSSVHADLLLFPEDVKLFTAPANKVRIAAVLSCHQCRKVQPLLHKLTGSWLLSICSGWISGKRGARLLCSVRSQGATSKSAVNLWSFCTSLQSLSLSFFSSRQKAALQLDKSVWETAGSIYTFCLQVGGKGQVHQRTRKEINNLLEFWGFF